MDCSQRMMILAQRSPLSSVYQSIFAFPWTLESFVTNSYFVEYNFKTFYSIMPTLDSHCSPLNSMSVTVLFQNEPDHSDPERQNSVLQRQKLTVLKLIKF